MTQSKKLEHNRADASRNREQESSPLSNFLANDDLRKEVSVATTDKGPDLYQDRGTDFERVVSMLSQAEDSFVVRLTGGCLNMSETNSAGLYNTFVTALLGFEGIVLSGATRSIADDESADVRPSIPEIGPMLERYLKNAQHLGLIPGSNLKPQGDGYMQVQRDSHNHRDWNIVAHPHIEKALVLSEETEYL